MNAAKTHKVDLFRIKVQIQKSLISPLLANATPPELIRKFINKKPAHEVRKGQKWHVGNVKDAEDNMLYFFAFGKTSRATIESFDSESKNFKQDEYPNAPYTQCYIRLDKQVLGIAEKTALPRTTNIAGYLQTVLNKESFETYHDDVRFVISPILDPQSFIELIHKAHTVINFTVEIGYPNILDVDRDVHRPMEELIRESDGGRDAKVSLVAPRGGNIKNRSLLEKLTRSVTAVGRPVRIRAQEKETSAPITRNTRDQKLASISVNDENMDNISHVGSAIEQRYGEIRHGEGRGGE
ncbi:MAG: hypothetical protein OXU94_04405 [Gammaproteobacteria bacterium]|nr:hypothetical protein [Gammaproteobacteria bacterium]